MYVSWNNFAVGGGAISGRAVRVTTVPLGATSGNRRTYLHPRRPDHRRHKSRAPCTSPAWTKRVVASPTGRTRSISSTDGGDTWTNTYTGPTFPGPGRSASGLLRLHVTQAAAYWRHMGWGEPAAYNGVVSTCLCLPQHGNGADPGDVFYIRSTDSGVTFSAPFQLNTDTTTQSRNGSLTFR